MPSLRWRWAERNNYTRKQPDFDGNGNVQVDRPSTRLGVIADGSQKQIEPIYAVRRMRILCIIPGLGSVGGAQRVIAYLVSQLAGRHDVTLMTLESVQTRSLYALSPLVRMVHAGLLGGNNIFQRAFRIVARFVAIRRQINQVQPHAILSFLDTMNITTIVSALGSGVPVVISERIDPLHHKIGAIKGLLRSLLYPLADCCVVQTERVKSYFTQRSRPKVLVIANPVPMPAHQANPGKANDRGRFRVIGLGRLDRQKGFDLLVEAFAHVARSFLDWDLVIFGDGPERSVLQRLIEQHNLQERVKLAGVTSDPDREFAASHILAFPSRYEGFANALAEGLAVGLPAIGHRGVSGVEEMIVANKTGLLVERRAGTDALAEGLRRLMASPELREQLGAQARRHMERWPPSKILQQWEACLSSVATSGK
jgi:GalNAc-alpha-(1->4)-GalNAc-alpha-(1->3)-diNAcBac-PP-undecaprenol alpha-1,4-N-acetyl-D-galactosaminyltransferase